MRYDYQGKRGKESRAVGKAREALRKLYQIKKEELGGRLKFENFYPIDLVTLVLQLGWKIETITGYPSYLGPTSPAEGHVDFQKKTIFLSVDKNIPSERRNMTLAHEIGHIMLHGEKAYRRLPRPHSIRETRAAMPSYLRQYDAEANRFAFELLMPARAVRRRFEELFKCSEVFVGSTLARHIIESTGLHGSVKRRLLSKTLAKYCPAPGEVPLCEFFGVSKTAMSIRLEELRLVLD